MSKAESEPGDRTVKADAVRCSDVTSVANRFGVLTTDLAGLFNVVRSMKRGHKQKYCLGLSTAAYIRCCTHVTGVILTSPREMVLISEHLI